MRKLFLLTAGWFVVQSLGFASAAWMSDYPAAQAKAKAENKLVLLNFTGSDWCGWCIKLKSEVFNQGEFESFAKDNLVLVEVDFPRRKELSQSQKKANEALAKQYSVRGFPTIIILDGAGQNLGKTGYRPGGPKSFIADLQRIGGNKLSKSSANSTAKAPEPTPAPLFNGAKTSPPPEYKELQVKGISGPTGRRLAIINNQTVAEGEAAMVKLGQNVVAVKVIEIRENGAVVLIGEKEQKKELRLAK